MWLLKASSIDDPLGPLIVDPPADQIPPYAILSHTWGTDEILFAHVQNWKPVFVANQSFKKVRFSCLQALRDDLEYVWIDSCCIDKSSSAELSEAINSMYQWYRDAAKCYVYFADVDVGVDVKSPGSEFTKSKWFTRGWTLQELLAPADLFFYSKEWSMVGEKTALSRVISQITGISEDILTGAKSVESASVAKRMSWAAYRKTTRREDVAYCLMGLFGVNMPMLYGEGDKAFLRLQEEIMKLSDDQSLFAWVDQEASTDSYHGLLAKSPLNFAHSNAMVPYEDWEPRPPYSMTSRGLCIDLPIRREGDLYVAALDCPVPPDYEESTFLAIYLKKLSRGGSPQYARVNVGKLAKVHVRGTHETIFVRQKFGGMTEGEGLYPQEVLQLRRGPLKEEYRVVDIILPPGQGSSRPRTVLSSRGATWSPREWLPGGLTHTLRHRRGPGQLSGALFFSRCDNDERLVVLIGSSDGFKVGFHVIEVQPELYPDEHPLRGATIAGEQRKQAFDVLQGLFKPSPVGRYVELRHNRVRVEVESIIHVDGQNILQSNGGTTSVADGAKYLLVDIYMEPIHRPSIVTEALKAANQGVQVGARLQMWDSAASEADTEDKELVGKGDADTRRTSKWRRLFS